MSHAVAVCFAVSLLTPAQARSTLERKLPEQARAILEKATEFELYSLEPDEEEKSAGKPTRLRGWKVLGKTTVKKAEAGKDLLDALEKGVASRRARGAKCFDPRHAIRAAHDGKRVDLLICFACGWVYVYYDGQEKEAAQVRIDRTFQPYFDKALRDAGVPLAKKPKGPKD
jgi:hypothetical protein